MTVGTASLLLSAVVALATVIYAILTWKLVTETSRLRAQNETRVRAEVAELAQKIIAEHSRIVDLATKLENEVNTLAGLTGNVGGSWHQRRIEELRAIPSQLLPLCRDAEQQAASIEALRKLSPEEVAALSGTLFSGFARLRVEKDKLRDELDDLRSQSLQQRAVTLRRVP